MQKGQKKVQKPGMAIFLPQEGWSITEPKTELNQVPSNRLAAVVNADAREPCQT